MNFIKYIDLKKSRKKFFSKNKNFIFLLKKRFLWMKKYIKNKKTVIEIGSGNCLIKNILSRKILCTDIVTLKNVSQKIDMNNFKLNTRYKKNVDVFIFNHSLHHSSNPKKLLMQLSKKFLKMNGYILINEPEISLIFKFFLKICKHERYDLNLQRINNKNFWEENNATGRLLFYKKKTNDNFQNYKIIANIVNECFIFLNCSGNGVDAPYVRLNNYLLKIIDKIDNILTKYMPNIFAMNRSVVLQKVR
jgi:hypothetical protein